MTVAAQTSTAIPVNAVRQVAFDAPVNAVIDGFGAPEKPRRSPPI